jgi:hypothetical protein
MANPLFYERVVPLDSVAHRALRLRPAAQPFAFAAGANLIPALLDEFGTAAPYMPVAFLPGVDKPAAVFVAGVKPGKNVFVDNGRWTGGYLPAYLRRYPFIMGDVPSGPPVLCMDEAFGALGNDEGERLFSETGEPEPTLSSALALAEGYRQGALRTEQFCATLQRLKLLRSVTLDARLDGGESTVVHGLMVVDEDAFHGLGVEDLHELQQQRFLRPIFEHLTSLAAISLLSPRKPATMASAES